MKIFLKNRILWLIVTIVCYVTSLLILYSNQLKLENSIELNKAKLEEKDKSIESYLEEINTKQRYLNSLQQQRNTLENQVKNLN